MKLRDVIDALVGEDLATMRRAFGALVAGQEVVEAASPGMLVVMLNRLCVALKDDPAEMPAATCGALDLPAGSSYADGAVRAKREGARLARHLMTAN